MRVVVNTESDQREVLGVYVGTDEDAVGYQATCNGAVSYAPGDCVAVVEVSDEMLKAEFDRLARQVESAKRWVRGDSTVALNSLVGVAVEMLDFASAAGAALTVDGAYAKLRREYTEGRRVGACFVRDPVALVKGS